jgi:hypothetical protein
MRVVRAWPAVVAFGLLAHDARGAMQGAGVAAVAGVDVVPRGATAALVERLAVDDAPLTSYRALRTLTAETRGGHLGARLTAWTSLDPVAGFQYSVVEEDGSGVIRQKVLHAALEAERALRAPGAADKAALKPTNYDFGDTAPADEGFVQIRIRPRRLDTMLVDGRILLTDPGGDLARVEGVLSKRPSFWTREVRVVRRYARIGGVRVPIEMQSEARVLLVGRSTFSMVYEYAFINGSAVNAGGNTGAARPER